MKKVSMFVCGMCHKIYDNEKEAIKCENRGKEQPLAFEGDVINEWKINFREEGIETHTLYKVEDDGHSISYGLGNKYDSLVKYVSEHTVNGNDEFLRLCRKATD